VIQQSNQQESFRLEIRKLAKNKTEEDSNPQGRKSMQKSQITDDDFSENFYERSDHDEGSKGDLVSKF